MGEVFGPNGALRRLKPEEIPVAAGMVFLAFGATAGLAMVPVVPWVLVAVAAAGFVPVVGFFGLGLAREAVARVRK